jgi:acyl-coenzyme A synthetase/AMP-(fatty) acid ligase
VIKQHPGVQESVVVVREDAAGQNRLVAYVAPDKNYAAEQKARVELWPSTGEYQIYDETLYYAMTHDELRNRSYEAAIKRLVKDKVVVEIGTGRDAISRKNTCDRPGRGA